MTGKKKNIQGKRSQIISGMTDILPETSPTWEYIITKLSKLAHGFGFSKAETPALEDYSLHESNESEQGTVINFADPDGNRIAIRPAILPGLIRAHAEHKIIDVHKLSKWYYLAPVASYDERQRKFVASWEYGFEVFGEINALIEVQLISLVCKFLRSIGLENVSLEINSVGKVECRKDYDDQLRSYLQSKKYELCNDCVASLDTYPLQVFRCKNLECKTVAAEAPQIVDFLDEDCHKHFTHVLEGLDELGIMYALNPTLVGKEGTSQITFVIKYKDDQNEYFIGEGSHHEDIYESISGKKCSCFGFVGYMEVLKTAINNLKVPVVFESRSEVFLVPLGDLASKKALKLFAELWDAQIAVHDHFGNIGVKNQLKLAETSKANIALIIGQKEAMDEMVILRDVKSGMQEVFQYERIIEEVKKRLGR